MTHYNNSLHTFHIPVMGLAYTIDSPVRVAHLGISSCISIIDDDLIEKMAEHYARIYNLDFLPISVKEYDYRARRITRYLDMVHDIVAKKTAVFKQSLADNVALATEYIGMLPQEGFFKKQFEKLLKQGTQLKENIMEFLDTHYNPGSIDVNIMTKVDKENRDRQNNPLPAEFNDAHASLRGFAQSKLSSSVVLSAGLNPRLYGYIENFADFYPDALGIIKKKIVLKVSDYRSAAIQSSFLAKKGLWVSEYRIESGLNCGGHAFATDGLLLGPIMEEFKLRKTELAQNAFSTMCKVLEQKGLPIPLSTPYTAITVQGGIGTAAEHDFLLSYYNADSVGWGSPLLLVPEATAVDKETRRLLADATEDDLYLSNMSPLGVPFNAVRGTSNEAIKKQRALNNRYGSACPKKYLALTPGESENICTAARKYQEPLINGATTQAEIDAIAEKSCLCVGLANPALMEKNILLKGELQGVVVCPGPNMAYFTEVVSLQRMLYHIYGRDNIITVPHRPNMFIKELGLYVNHYIKEAAKVQPQEAAALKKLNTFRQNLLSGIAYYKELFMNTKLSEPDMEPVTNALNEYEKTLNSLHAEQNKPHEYICTKSCASCQCKTVANTL